MALRFYNSLSRRVDDFVPIVPGRVGLYTCGPTVYDYAHIGNFRAYVFEDILKRVLRFSGYDVLHVMNLTDVDDKTIRNAQRAGMSLDAFTRRYKDAFFEDIAVLNIEPADVYPAATEHIPEMIELIQTLLTKGVGYQAEDGSVYFSIAAFPEYGKLVRIEQDQLRVGARVRQDEYAKETAADFALWKAHDADDGDVFWDSPWGRGRPGWHVECSAMSMKYLGPTFDIHCGGVDNMFPHHEDEIAQSEAANGCKFVNYWLHNAHLVVDGEKMSKSLGNFFTLRNVLERGYSGRELRWVLMGTHYRQALNFSFQACDNARAALQRLDDFVLRLREAAVRPDAGTHGVRAQVSAAKSAFAAGLADDLNVSAALGALFELVRDLHRMMDQEEIGGSAADETLAALRHFDTVLGVLDVDAAGGGVPSEISALAEARDAARKARDYARADALRDDLAARGWVVEDTAAGPRLKRM